MSRIGKQPIPVPSSVTISADADIIRVVGPKGELSQPAMKGISLEISDGECLVLRKNDSIRNRAMHGLYRQLVNNMVVGVSEGYNRTLIITGVGYRVELSDKNITLNLGYSVPIEYETPEGITFQVEGQNKLVISGIDKQQVGQIAAEIRSLRPPEPYKGKGISYQGEIIRRKVGKAGIK